MAAQVQVQAARGRRKGDRAPVAMIPPKVVRGKGFNQSTNLGKLIAYRGYTIMQVQALAMVEFGPHTGINNRTMTEYLAGRREIPPAQRAVLAKILDVKPEMI